MCEIHGTRDSGHHKTRRRSRRFFVATRGPRAMYFTYCGKPWLKPIIIRHNIAKYVLSLLKCYLPCEKKQQFHSALTGTEICVLAVPILCTQPAIDSKNGLFQTTVFLKNIYNVHSAIQHFYNTSLYICTLYNLAIWRRQGRWGQQAWGIEGTES